MSTFLKKSYKYFLRPILFTQDAEKVHNRFLNLGENLGKNFITRFSTSYLFNYENEMLNQTVDGVFYKNPIGLAAGFDKNARLTQILADVGFGFEEVGSLTNKPYKGNPPPKLTRLPKSKSIIVYYGLKNNGVDEIIPRLSKLNFEIPIGVSVAKTNSKDTAKIKGGINDYFECFKKVVISKVGAYITVNISCPNAFGGEPFTDKISLEKLFIKLDKVKTEKPVYVKMPIELSLSKTGELIEVLKKHNVQGLIIGNLAKDRQNPKISSQDYYKAKEIKGGLSGKPTEDLSNKLIEFAYKNFGRDFTIIGCGGVFSAEDAFKKITLGSTLIQLITGMIFEGPQLIGDINRGLFKIMKEKGFRNIKEAIGTNIHS